MIDDFESEMKEYREYDFSHEQIKKDHFHKSKPMKCIILAEYKQSEQESAEDKVLFKRDIAFFQDQSMTRYFETRLSAKD